MSALLCKLILFAVSAAAAPVPPQAVPGGEQSALTLRAFLERGSLTGVGEAEFERESGGRQFKQFGAGAYYRLNDFLKAGAFYDRAYGLRHDEDWHSVNGVWSWNDSNNRFESLFCADLTARAMLEFLPAEDWVGELKVRYVYNAFNDDRTLAVRPGLTYFFTSGDEMVANVFARFELDFPLNYGTTTLTQHWIYLGGMWRLSDMWDVGPFVNFGWETWGPPQAYKDKNGTPYSITTQTTTLGIAAILHL